MLYVIDIVFKSLAYIDLEMIALFFYCGVDSSV